MAKKTKSQEYAESWVHELIKTNGHIHEALRRNKHEKRAIARLLRAGYASANFVEDGPWEKEADMMPVDLDTADVLLALANLIGADIGHRTSHDDVEREFVRLASDSKPTYPRTATK